MKRLNSLAIILLFSSNVFAQQDIQLEGTTQYPLKSIQNNNMRVQTQAQRKFIRLLNIKLSDNAWEKLTANSSTRFSSESKSTVRPNQVQLGMNQVPVLDQGPYGTCVTFANTAAIDAALNQGDYISQLCQLELGQHLENNALNLPSGWNGSMGSIVLNQMYNFGIVTKETEKTGLCGDLTSYPTNGAPPETEITLADYKQIATLLSDHRVSVEWSSLMDPHQAFMDDIDRDQMLETVKNVLNKGDRLTFGVLLFAPNIDVMGASAQNNAPYDTWVITPLIERIINSHGEHGGHEMIITGYDDDATAQDEQGRIYKGLLTLRNSWGNKVGDAGNFYMSYDYFKRLAVEIQRIRQL